MRAGSAGAARRPRGFTYLWVLFAVAFVGVGLAAGSTVWSRIGAAQKRSQFLWAGEQYRSALGRYYDASPGFAKVFPQQLADLLEDRRGYVVRRHLRALYGNPFAADDAGWEIIRAADGGIRGVRGRGADPDDATRATEFVYVPAVSQ